MKRLPNWALLIVASSLIAFSPKKEVAASDVCQPLGNHRYMNIYDYGPGRRERGYICFLVENSSNLQGVLTLKHLSNTGNWDLLVGTDFDPSSKTVYNTINYQNNRGTSDELMWLPSNNNREYVVVAFPNSDTPSEACMIFHQVDAAGIAGEAIGMTLIQNVLEYLFTGPEASQESKNAASRVISGGMSILNNRNIGEIGYDLMLNEISNELTDAFGGGSWLFDFGLEYFSGYLQQSGKFLFDKNMRCTD